MECKVYQEQISAYLDNQLTMEETQLLMAHIEGCPACKQELQALKQIKNLLNQMPETTLPNHFHEDLMKRVQLDQKQVRLLHGGHWKWQYSGALVAAVAVIMIGVGTLRGLNIHSDGIPQLTNQLENSQSKVATAEEWDSASQPASEQREERVFSVEESAEATEDVGRDETPNAAISGYRAETASISEIPSLTWTWQVANPLESIAYLEAYLVEQDIPYERQENHIWCQELVDSERLWQWLNQQEGEVVGEPWPVAADVEIIIEQ